MALMTSYFIAPSATAAAAVIDHDGGPSALGARAVKPRRGFLRRKPAPALPDSHAQPFPTVDGRGVEPVVQMAEVEALLTGRASDDLIAEDSIGQVIADRGNGERLVVKLTDALSGALANATDDDLREIARPWAATEEFWGEGDPDDLAALLQSLAGLARRARENGDSLYCWLSL
ncbi:hypothetical protein [Demequina soli]|uniref:hypothetical protein n=1 Tax=Demequina soli TaxID=1638987 RepID=UPI000784A457|nr:hypothetical protein [Demequina soli]